MPEAGTNFQMRMVLPAFETWLRARLTENVGYDEFVRDLLTAPLANDGRRMMAGPYPDDGQGTPLAYFVAKEVKPENLAASTARLFLGVRLECAQCHDHPAATWKREQFWSYAAFFAGLQR